MSRAFSIEIRCEGAPFEHNGISNLHAEVADILRGVARSFENDEPLTPFRHLVRDSNGNSCGMVKFYRTD